AVTGVMSSPPMLDWIPVGPAGTRTVTVVRGRNPRAGVNTALLPSTCQDPSMAGLSVGIGEFAPRGAEKSTPMLAAPLTPPAPAEVGCPVDAAGTGGRTDGEHVHWHRGHRAVTLDGRLERGPRRCGLLRGKVNPPAEQKRHHASGNAHHGA